MFQPLDGEINVTHRLQQQHLASESEKRFKIQQHQVEETFRAVDEVVEGESRGSGRGRSRKREKEKKKEKEKEDLTPPQGKYIDIFR
jgi:CRISPR/Cas system-associated endonuclease Cas1